MQIHNENGNEIATKKYDKPTNIYPQAPIPSFPDSRGSLLSREIERSTIQIKRKDCLNLHPVIAAGTDVVTGRC